MTCPFYFFSLLLSSQQAAVRRHLQQVRYRTAKQGTVKLQAMVRGRQARKAYLVALVEAKEQVCHIIWAHMSRRRLWKGWRWENDGVGIRRTFNLYTYIPTSTGEAGKPTGSPQTTTGGRKSGAEAGRRETARAGQHATAATIRGRRSRNGATAAKRAGSAAAAANGGEQSFRGAGANVGIPSSKGHQVPGPMVCPYDYNMGLFMSVFSCFVHVCRLSSLPLSLHPTQYICMNDYMTRTSPSLSFCTSQLGV